MDSQELQEITEHAERRKEKAIGLTTAIFAVLLAVTTMLGHRDHTAEVLWQTRAADQWSYYQAKNIRRHMYAADLQLAGLQGRAGKRAGVLFQALAAHEQAGLKGVRAKAEKFEAASAQAEHRADRFDLAEIFFELSVVLCSIALLAESRLYWRLSLASGAVGLALLAYAGIHLIR